MELIAAFFRVEHSPMGRLLRIEGWVVIGAAILLLSSVLDSYGLRSSSALKLTLVVLDAVSTSIVTYTIGLAQNAGFGFQSELLQVQVLLLYILKRSICPMSAYSIDQTQARRSWEAGNMMESLWVLYLLVSRGTRFYDPLWFLWYFNWIKMVQRMSYFEKANKVYGVGSNSIVVAYYTKYEHELSSQPNQVDPALVSGYKYLVLGEGQQGWNPQTPPHLMTLTVTREDKLITLDKIFQCKGRLLRATGVDADGKLKDLCLSFAMYKLLRLRIDNMHRSPESEYHLKHHNLFMKGLISDGFQRPFRVAEVELAFLGDLFHTRYPIIFSGGLPISHFVLPWLILMACCYLSVQLSTVDSWEGQLRHIEHGVDVGKVIAILLLIVVALKELWEMITYISSDWAKVVLLCKYVEKPSWQKSKCVEKMLGCLCRLRIWKPWHGKIGQYSLLGSFDYEPWNLGPRLTLGLIDVTAQGRKECNPIKVSNAVKEAVLNALILSNGQLTNGKSSLARNEVEVSWTLDQDTMTHSILIWHIATSLCEIELLRKCKANDGNLTRPKKYLKIPRSCAAYIKNRWKPLPFYANLENLEGNLQYHYEIAASLSRYCAYLVAFQQVLVSDPSLDVEYALTVAIQEARRYFEGHGSMESRYEKMMATADPSETIIANGVKLGKQLIETIESDEVRWKVLAEFWAEWILYMAPSGDTSAHKSALGRGGEFMTLLWALLTHAGIPEQSEAPGSTV